MYPVQVARFVAYGNSNDKQRTWFTLFLQNQLLKLSMSNRRPVMFTNKSMHQVRLAKISGLDIQKPMINSTVQSKDSVHCASYRCFVYLVKTCSKWCHVDESKLLLLSLPSTSLSLSKSDHSWIYLSLKQTGYLFRFNISLHKQESTQGKVYQKREAKRCWNCYKHWLNGFSFSPHVLALYSQCNLFHLLIWFSNNHKSIIAFLLVCLPVKC